MKVVTRTLAEWLALQEQVHARAIDLGLGRVGTVARTLHVQRPHYRVITVGGTNGKGSTVATLEALLLTQGLSVGTLTSPHLLRYNERIHVAGREATDAELVDVFERIEAARAATTLTFFDTTPSRRCCCSPTIGSMWRYWRSVWGGGWMPSPGGRGCGRAVFGGLRSP